jgi:acetyltransferase-like isoleucine patch superfamily enzyme
MHATLHATPTAALLLSDRVYEERVIGGPNAHASWWKARNHLDGPLFGPLRLMVNYVVISMLKHSPSLALKRWILRTLGMRLGRGVTIASGVMFDFFFPELIEIGDHSIIGMDAMLLTHEFLSDRLRLGRVRIGARCVVGARSTVLAGVDVGPGSVIGAMSLVNKGIPEGAFAGGMPIRLLNRQGGPGLTGGASR